MSGNYEFDQKSYNFRERSIRLKNVLLGALKFLLVSFTLTVIVYTLLALVFNTDVDRKLSRENRMYEMNYRTLLDKEALVKDAVASLEYRDDEIYNLIFHTESPGVDPIRSISFGFESDSIPERKIVDYTRDKADRALGKAACVEEDFARIYRTLARPGFSIPPMSLPLSHVSFPQIGASVGDKMSPFLKTYAYHSGLDLVASLEDPVLATANGTVKLVARSRKGQGNVIEIEHPGGYVSRYAHLSATLVRKGQKVKTGQKIGTVGMTGNSFAPHLHYELIRDGVCVDPVNYFFASVAPEDYANMLFMAVNTDKSMD